MSKTVASRRKQTRPSRLAETMSDSTETSNCSTSGVIVKACDFLRHANSYANQYLAGTILGPFQVRSTAVDNCDCPTEIERNEIARKLQLFATDENSVQRVLHLQIAKTSKSANCDLFGSENGLFIRVNRTVESFSELCANFYAPLDPEYVSSPKTTATSTPVTSPVCSIPDTLSDSAVPSTSYDLPTEFTPPHAIYLPVAYHNSPSVNMQILGYPQVVIPVAVNRANLPLYTPTIFIDETLAHGLILPRTIRISETQSAIRLTTLGCCTNGAAEETPKPNRKRLRQPEKTTLSRDSSAPEYGPLDLSVSLGKRQSEVLANSKPMSSTGQPANDLEKRFHCDCGVSFNNEATMLGHKKYYCKNTNHTEVFREPQRKVPNRCQQCDFQPASTSQLAQHVRSSHAVVQAYICQICGYRGYSQRGIRSHLRTHSECINCADADLIAAHVFLMTLDSKNDQCSKCKKFLPSNAHLKQHKCD